MGRIKHHTFEFIKKTVLNFAASGQSYREYAKSHQMCWQTLRSWIKKLSSGRPVGSKRVYAKGATHKNLEKELHAWILQQNAAFLSVSDRVIQERALAIAASRRIRDFKASKGWVHLFKKRNRLVYRAATHVSRKQQPSEQDIEQEIEFLDEMVELNAAVEQDPSNEADSLNRIYNMDQTNVRLVDPKLRTVTSKGVKQVILSHPPGDKEGFTVTITVKPTGEILPAVIVFKGAARTGKLSENIMRSLKVPPNVKVESSRKAWWTEDLDHSWIETTFGDSHSSRILIRDQYTVHKLDSSAELLENLNVRQIFIPAGRTGDHSALDVGINRAFKTYYREEYEKWRRMQNPLNRTKAGYMKKPTRQDFIDFVSQALSRVSDECVKNSFVGAGIVNLETYATAAENADVFDESSSSLNFSCFDPEILDPSEDD